MLKKRSVRDYFEEDKTKRKECRSGNLFYFLGGCGEN